MELSKIENFAVELTDKAPTYDEWLFIVRFGLATLLKNQPLFFEIMSRQASVMVERKGIAGYVTADALRQIFSDLDLLLVVAARRELGLE